MMSKMDEVFRKVLNDREIFDSPYDRRTRTQIPKLFEGKDWKRLGRLFEEGKKNEFIREIDSRIKELEQRSNKQQQKQITKLKQRTKWLKSAFDKKPHLLKHLFENLEWYGLVECKLPNMENYGKVIERYDLSIVEQYFMDKIKRVSYPQNKALERILEYVKELYSAGFSSDEIGYFVRKVNSLTKYWEVIE